MSVASFYSWTAVQFFLANVYFYHETALEVLCLINVENFAINPNLDNFENGKVSVKHIRLNDYVKQN
jgi:hypothetical protein